MKIIYKIIMLLLITSVSYGQVPVPADPQSGPIMLVGGTAHLGTGEIIENAVIAFDKGKLTAVGNASDNISQADHQVIDISGKHIYPGFILPNSQVGLKEVESIRHMNDFGERGTIKPNVRSIISYNTDSEYPPTFRFNGILLAETTPTGGIISGTSSVVEFDGWNWEDAAHTMDMAIHMNWPSKMSRRFDRSTFTIVNEPNKNFDKTVDEINKLFTDAVSYAKLASKPANLKLASMQGLFDGSKVLMIHSSNPKEVIESIKFAKMQGVSKIVIITNDAAWFVRDFLKENNIPVIMSQTHRRPARADYDYDMSYKLPGMLTDAGLSVSLSWNGMLSRARNLPFLAGTAAAYGMEKEEALKTITLNTAKALGVDNRVGSIEVGKDATLFVSEGDALDMRGNNITHAFISGKLVTLDNKQEALYNRYSDKYGHIR